MHYLKRLIGMHRRSRVWRLPPEQPLVILAVICDSSCLCAVLNVSDSVATVCVTMAWEREKSKFLSDGYVPLRWN